MPRNPGERGGGREGPLTAPGDLVGESTAEQGARDRGDPPHAANGAKGHGPLGERQGVAEDDDGAGEEAGGTDAGDGAADDEGVGVGSQGADQAADLEDEDGRQVGVFDAEDAVQGAVCGLQGRRGQEVRGAVPADVLDARELLGQAAQGRRDDGLVQGDEENGQAKRRDDEGQLEALGQLGAGAAGRRRLHAVQHSAAGAAGRLLDSVAVASFVVVADITADITTDVAAVLARLRRRLLLHVRLGRAHRAGGVRTVV